MKIIKHGEIVKDDASEIFTSRCNDCGCVIEMRRDELCFDDLNNTMEYVKYAYVECPTCCMPIQFVKGTSRRRLLNEVR